MSRSRNNAPGPRGEQGPIGRPTATAAQPSIADAALVEKLLVRYQVNIRRRLPVLLLSLTSMVLLTLCFEPFNCWWLPWFALVPWLAAIATSNRWGWMLFCSWLAGFLFFASNLYWLLACGSPGPVKGMLLMALAQLALSAYMGCYFLLFAYVIGGLVRRWGPPDQVRRPSGLLMIYLVPIAWVGTEILRGYVMSGFPWFILGHSLYQRISMIQLADLGGAYGLSFLIAAVNGVIADGLLQPLFLSARKGPHPNYKVSAAAVAMLGLVLLTMVYGRFRIDETDRSVHPGPRVAVIQGYYPVNLQGDRMEDMDVRFRAHLRLAEQAIAAAPRADLVAWPETMIDANLNAEFLRIRLVRPTDPELVRRNIELIEAMEGFLDHCRQTNGQLRDTAHREKVALLVGAHAMVPAPAEIGAKPMDIAQFYNLIRSDPAGEPGPDNPQMLRHNSAYLLQPRHLAPGEHTEGSTGATTASDDVDPVVSQRYDKHHLVPFGEYLPFRTEWPEAFSLLRQLTPMDLLMPGSNLEPLKLNTRDGREFAFAAPICYEDVIPQAIRPLVYEKSAPGPSLAQLLAIGLSIPLMVLLAGRRRPGPSTTAQVRGEKPGLPGGGTIQASPAVLDSLGIGGGPGKRAKRYSVFRSLSVPPPGSPGFSPPRMLRLFARVSTAVLVVLILACLGWVVLDSYHQAGAKKADFLVNISNDGWFAGTTELWQHRASSAFRCVENRVPMARSVNCGCSGFYDSLGRPMGVIPPGKTGHLSAVLPMDKRTTIYSRLGDGLGFDCVALLFAGMVIVFRQRRRAKTGGSG